MTDRSPRLHPSSAGVPRPRSSSNASARSLKYVPDGYPAPTATAPQGFQPQPYRNNDSPASIQFIDPRQPAPESVRPHARRASRSTPAPILPDYDQEDRARPHTGDSAPEYNRRHSASSYRSHHSTRSHHSRPSHDSKRSHHSHAYEDDRHTHHHDRPDRQQRRASESALKRRDTPRPTLGGTVLSLWGTIKDALGPRDKY